MRSVYFWYLAQLVAVVVAVMVVRVGLVSVGNHMVATQLNAAALQVANVEGAGGLDLATMEELGGETPPPVDGDALGNAPPMRREGPIHDDHQRAGQLVIRDGQRVILIDDSDPENEIWVPLNATPPMPWYADNGWGPNLAALVGGSGVYLLFWGFWNLFFRRPTGEVSAA